MFLLVTIWYIFVDFLAVSDHKIFYQDYASNINKKLLPDAIMLVAQEVSVVGQLHCTALIEIF